MPKETELEKMAADLARAEAEAERRETEIVRLKKEATDIAAALRVREEDLAKAKLELDRERAKHADPEEELLKGLSEPARKLVLDTRAANEALRKKLSSEEDARQTAEIAKNISKELGHLPTKADAFAPVLKKVMAALSEEENEILRACLKAGSDALADMEKLQMLGRNGGVAKTSTEARVEKMARERAVEKGITFEKAYAAILQEDPSLYAKITAETHELRAA